MFSHFKAQISPILNPVFKLNKIPSDFKVFSFKQYFSNLILSFDDNIFISFFSNFGIFILLYFNLQSFSSS